MDFLIKCQNLFLGLVSTADEEENGDGAAAKDTEGEASDDDVDGMPLTAAAALAAKGGHTHIPGIGLGYVIHFIIDTRPFITSFSSTHKINFTNFVNILILELKY